MKCEYGCNQEALYQLKNKKWCCSKSFNSCEAIKQKNSLGLKKAYKDGKKNVDHFDGKRGWRKGMTAFSDERIKSKFKNDIFIENSKVSRSYLRKILISENIIEYKCSKCGLSEWNGEKLVLEIEHINGIRNDNRLENLTFLCPNCHSQTNTWRRSKDPKNKLKDVDYLNALIDSNNIKNALEKINRCTSSGNYERMKKILKDLLI